MFHVKHRQEDVVKRQSWPTRLAIKLVRLYQQKISGLKPTSTCRFDPTCSQYSLNALRQYGLLRSIPLIIARIVKCAPWHPGGWDPVPLQYPQLSSWFRRLHR